MSTRYSPVAITSIRLIKDWSTTITASVETPGVVIAYRHSGEPNASAPERFGPLAPVEFCDCFHQRIQGLRSFYLDCQLEGREQIIEFRLAEHGEAMV